MKNDEDIEEKMVLRPATEGDCRFIWELRNHPTARKFSINLPFRLLHNPHF